VPLEDARLRGNNAICPNISLQLWVMYFVSNAEGGGTFWNVPFNNWARK